MYPAAPQVLVDPIFLDDLPGGAEDGTVALSVSAAPHPSTHRGGCPLLTLVTA